MREGRSNRFSISTAGLLVLLVLLAAGVAYAKKPAPPPPPDPDPVDTGTLYYTTDATNGLMRAVSSDGTDLGTMHANVQGLAEPSLLLHPDDSGDDVRWFLQVEVADAAYQLYAVSENGYRKRLVEDPTLNVGGRGASYAYPRWADDDGLVSFCAVQYDRDVDLDPDTYDPDPNAMPLANGTGQYLLAIDPDTMAPLSTPVFIPMPINLNIQPQYDTDGNLVGWTGDAAGNTNSDVSASGLSIVYQRYADDAGTWRADASDWTDPTALLSGSFLYCPRWSPDEAWICGFTVDGIEVISSSGGSLATVVPDPEDSRRTTVKVDRPFWSPSGTHLGYRVVKTDVRKGTKTHEIHTVDLDTGSTSYFCDGYIRGWR